MNRFTHRDQLILRYLRNGHTRNEAADHFGLLLTTIQRVEARDSKLARALDMVRAGRPTREIAAAVGVSGSTIKGWAKAEGLQIVREKRLTPETKNGGEHLPPIGFRS